MPFVVCRTNGPISQEQETELKTRLGSAIINVPGKSEHALLVCIQPDSHLWLAGDNYPCAYIEASVFANEDHAGYRAFSTEVAKAFFEVLNIPVNRIFVRYDDIPVWSVGNMVSDRAMFC